MTRGAVLAAVTAVTITLWTPSGFTQPTDELKALRNDIEALKEGQTAIQKELQEIKGLLLLQAGPRAAAPPQEAVVSVEGAPFKGKKDAKVTLVDFTDYQ
jgi:protein-disulfide isomerase